jgi:putative ABC transport system permease protein
MMLGMSWLDWKLGGRMLLKYPGLSVIGGLTLAIAIGLGAVWFEVTHQMLNPRLPLPEGDRIVSIENWDAAASHVEPRSLYDFQIWRTQLTSIRELGAYRSYERNLITPDGNAQPAEVAGISASAFALTRVPPLLGRTLIDADEVPGAPDVIVIGYDIWQSRFNGALDVVGRTVRIGRTQATIVGVMPQGFGFPVSHQLWLPLRPVTVAPRQGPGIRVFGRLAEGASLEVAQAELTTIGQRVAAVNATTHAQLRPRVERYGAIDLDEALLARLSNIIGWLILAAACANVATLMFARTATREAEIVVRNALGASRRRVMMQLLVEALVLSCVSAVAGLVAASFILDFGVGLLADEIGRPFWFRFSLGPATLLYAGLMAVGGAVLTGLLPALRATGPRVQTALTKMSGGSTSIRFGGVWSVMIVLQVAFAALCLPFGFAAAVFVLHEGSRSSFPGAEYLTFRPELDGDVAGTATGEFPEDVYRTRLLHVHEELRRRLESDPSVAAVTFANGLPGTYYPLRKVEAQRGNGPPVLVDANIESDRVKTATVDIGYFDAFGFSLVAGRAFHSGDIGADNAVIINETLARNIGGNPLGVRIRYAAGGTEQPASPWFEVVGVVRDEGSIEPGKPDFVYLAKSAADVSPLQVAVHVRGDAAAFASRLRATATQVEPGLRLYDILSLDEVLRRRRLPEIHGAVAGVAFVLLIAALSAAGLYSLMSVAVTRRTREIGIRLAIGANPRAVLAALFARAATQITIGILIANALMAPTMRLLGISELRVLHVLVAMAVTSAGMLLIGLAACAVPARRALRIQATQAMKYVG